MCPLGPVYLPYLEKTSLPLEGYVQDPGKKL